MSIQFRGNLLLPSSSSTHHAIPLSPTNPHAINPLDSHPAFPYLFFCSDSFPFIALLLHVGASGDILVAVKRDFFPARPPVFQTFVIPFSLDRKMTAVANAVTRIAGNISHILLLKAQHIRFKAILPIYNHFYSRQP